MASSSSIKHAQAIKVCELCEVDSIKWRCIDCDKCLCEKCKTIHLRVPVTAQHQIVTIGTPLQDVQKKIFTDNIPCKDHPKRMTCLFCRSCDFLICPDCVSASHKTHDFIPIDSALDEKLEYLRGIHDKIIANLIYCESEISESQTAKPKYKAIFDKSLSSIKKKEQELINTVKKYSKDLQMKVENEQLLLNSTLTKIRQDAQSTKKELEDQKQEIDAILSSNQGSLIFKDTIKIKELKFDNIPNKIEQFIPETETTQKIQEFFGSLQKLPVSLPTTPALLPPKDFEVIGSFNTNLPYVGHVVPINKTSAWINCYEEGVIRKINIRDDQMIVSKEVSMSVYDIALTQKNELLLSTSIGSQIKLLKKSGEVLPFLTVAPLISYGIHVTKNNDVIVGVAEPFDPYKTNSGSQRAVMLFKVDGSKKILYQYNKNKQTLIIYPSRITTNYNEDILVVDGTSDYTGKVVALNKDGNFRWLYEGSSEINESFKFDPRVVATTSEGYVVVSDFNSLALHILSEDGEVLTCQVMKRYGIIWPWGLGIDTENKLWLGCGEGLEHTESKLHILKFIS